MCAERSAQITEQSEQQIRLRICRDVCTGCDGKCLGILLSRADQNSVVVGRNLLDSESGGFSAGNRVTVMVRSETLIALSSLVYLLPLVLMLLSAVACEMVVSQSDSAVAWSAVFGLVCGLALVKTVLSKLDHNRISQTLSIRPEKPGTL